MSEMSYARQLLKGNRVDRAHMRQAENEHCYGEQLRLWNNLEGCGMLGYLLANLGFGLPRNVVSLYWNLGMDEPNL